ncbi:MAG TPA: glycosyltransferase family 2 protein [Saprospiraceae bacterium]|nr:glycosyltransferase family 2 protein [Saprospiraceae bacterium]
MMHTGEDENEMLMVSIIINNYNYGRFLKDAIDSAIQQTYSPIEVIVVDDGSTDASRKVIEAYGNKIIPVFKENGGQASSLNKGFQISKGQIVIFLDADDYLTLETVQKVVDSMQDPNIVKVHWLLLKIDHQNNLTGETLPDDKLSEGNLREQVIQLGPSKCGGPPNSPPTSGNAWSRNFLHKVLPIPEDVFKGGADNYLFVLAPLFGKIKKINEPLGFYRVHGDNNTLKPDYMNTFFNRYEECCNALSYHLTEQGVRIDPTTWPRDHWYHLLKIDIDTIVEIVPPADTFILVDENHWMTGDSIQGRHRILFTEKNGIYWGPPINDEAAIVELEQDRQKGANYIVFTWPTFWWLDHFDKFHDHLKSNYNCVMQNDRLVIYNLTN